MTHECPHCHKQSECPNPDACNQVNEHGLLDAYHYLCEECCIALSTDEAEWNSNRGGL